jgi:hypothetical protein
MLCKGVQLKDKLRIVAKVDKPNAVAAMLRHLGLDQDPNPDPTKVANECGPQLELAFDFAASTIRLRASHRFEGKEPVRPYHFSAGSQNLPCFSDAPTIPLKNSVRKREKVRDEKPH